MRIEVVHTKRGYGLQAIRFVVMCQSTTEKDYHDFDFCNKIFVELQIKP